MSDHALYPLSPAPRLESEAAGDVHRCSGPEITGADPIPLRTDGTGVWRGDTGLATHDAAGAPTREAVEAENEALREEVAEYRREEWEDCGNEAIRDLHNADRNAYVAELEAKVGALEAALRDFAEQGTRFDLHPTTNLRWEADAVHAFWTEYVARIDRAVRERAAWALNPARRVAPTETADPPPETPHKPTSAIPGASAGEVDDVPRFPRFHCPRCPGLSWETMEKRDAHSEHQLTPEQATAYWLQPRADAPAGQVRAATQESGEKGPEKAELVPANYLSPWRGFSLCADCRRTLIPDEARAGSLCEGCGGRR